jgi:hypothetical protein
MKRIFSVVFAVVMVFSGVPAALASHGTDLNCSDFVGKPDELKKHWTEHGYSAENDPEGLDGWPKNKVDDGIPCEGELGEGWWDGKSDNDNGSDNGSDKPSDNSGNNNDNNSGDKSDDSNSSDKGQGGKMPKTALDSVTMALIGMVTAFTGVILFFVRRRAEQ